MADDEAVIPPSLLEQLRQVRDQADEMIRRLEGSSPGREIRVTVQDTLGMTDTVRAVSEVACLAGQAVSFRPRAGT